MEIFITGDTDIRSGISGVLSEMRKKDHDFDYCLAKIEEGELNKIGIILFCTSFIDSNPRVRFYSEDKRLSFDIIFNFDQDLKDTVEDRRKRVANAIINDTEKYLLKYKKTKLKNVDVKRIINTFKRYFKKLNWYEEEK